MQAVREKARKNKQKRKILEIFKNFSKKFEKMLDIRFWFVVLYTSSRRERRQRRAVARENVG